MAHVFLTNPPLNMAETPLQYHRPLVPMGLAYLGAVLEREFTDGAYDEHVRARLRGNNPGRYRGSGRVAAQDNMRLSFYDQYHLDHLLDRMEAFFAGVAPEEQFIGLSVLSDGMRAARSMLREIRFRFRLATIIVGGPHATFFPHDFYELPESREGPLADFVVMNEGENAILGIVGRKLENAESLRENAAEFGINASRCDYSDPDYRVIDGGQYRATGATISAHVLDELPAPAYFLFEDDSGRLPYEPDRRYGLVEPAANINSSRGCPHHCTFCTIPMLVPGYRTLSPARMADIVEFLARECGVQSVFFREDNFMYSGGAVSGDRWPDIAEFCKILLDRRIEMKWAIEARSDNILGPSGTAGRSRGELMRQAGLSGVYMGVESGSDLMLKLFVKGASAHEMAQALDACRSHDIAVIATALYADPDLFHRSGYASIGHTRDYARTIIEQRERILEETRRFLDVHEIPLAHREEYAMVGIPVSASYRLLQLEGKRHRQLIEHYDKVTRYIYPKGFQWWATKIYDAKRGVRPYFGYEYLTVPRACSSTVARDTEPTLLSLPLRRSR